MISSVCPAQLSFRVSFKIVGWNLTDIRFQENMQNFLNLKLQKCDACQNGVEFCHKPIGDDAVICETGFTL